MEPSDASKEAKQFANWAHADWAFALELLSTKMYH